MASAASARLSVAFCGVLPQPVTHSEAKTSSTIDVEFEQQTPLRTERLRGHSFLMRSNEGMEELAIHYQEAAKEQQDESTGKNNNMDACRKALFEYIQQNQANSIVEEDEQPHKTLDDDGERTTRKFIITGIPVQKLIEYFEKNGGTSDLVGR